MIAQGKNGVEAVNLIKEHTPDLVFLDVQMPGLDGFGVIKRLIDKKVALPQIVFATAFDQYAVKAFEVNAVDYLLKPFDKKRVAMAVQKARKNLQSDPPLNPSSTLDSLVKMLEAQIPQPAPNQAQPEMVRTVVIQIAWTGDQQTPALKINDEQVNWENLHDRLFDIFKQRAERVAFVKGDDDVDFQYVADAISIARTSGVEKIGLLTKTGPESP